MYVLIASNTVSKTIEVLDGVKDAIEYWGVKIPPDTSAIHYPTLIKNLEVGGDLVIVEDLPIGFRNYMNFPTGVDRLVTTTGRVFLQENGQFISNQEFSELTLLPGTEIIPNIQSIVPQMTSNTAPPPFVASASSESSTTTQAYKAFQENTDYWLSTAIPASIQIYLGNIYKVGLYRLTQSNVAGQHFRGWTLYGSNDGLTWDTLHVIAEIADFVGAKDFIPDVIGNYSYYKLDIIKGNGSINIRVRIWDLFSDNSFVLPNTPKDSQNRAMWVLAN